MRILIIEDERQMATLLEQALVEDGHTVTTAYDGFNGLSLAETNAFDLVVMDVMLPRLDGWTVVRRLRAARSSVPVLMLTARDTTADIVQGLSFGADDYLVKPFSLDILLARARALGRRGPAPLPVVLRVSDLMLDQGTREVRRRDKRISLTRTEYSILELLMRQTPRVVTYAALLDAVWGGDADVEINTIAAFVRLLRNKIEGEEHPRLLWTIRGVGYALRVEE